jgi:hypothetical protein
LRYKKLKDIYLIIMTHLRDIRGTFFFFLSSLWLIYILGAF